jgi:hypothetical protein
MGIDDLNHFQRAEGPIHPNSKRVWTEFYATIEYVLVCDPGEMCKFQGPPRRGGHLRAPPERAPIDVPQEAGKALQ